MFTKKTKEISETPIKKTFFVSLFTNPVQLLVFFVSLLLLPVLFLTYIWLIPASGYKPAPVLNQQKEYAQVSVNASDKEALTNIIKLEKERNFEKNRLLLADQDSIYMVIDLPARKIAIEIKGVQVRTASILRVEPDQKLALFAHEHLVSWLNEPFTLKKYIGTIPKIPIVVKDAPKDTIEAQKLSTKPLPPDSTVVFTTLCFDRNLIIEINQDQKPLERELVLVNDYLTKRTEWVHETPLWAKILNPAATDQPLNIRLIVSPPDARAIYRAIPSRTNLVLKL